MPELPEVETLRRELDKAVRGKTIKSVELDWPKTVRPLSVKSFRVKVKNKKILGVKRRAKVLIVDLAGQDDLLIHLKLTGQLIFQPKDPSGRSGRLPLLRGGKSPSPFIRGRLGGGMIIGGHPQKNGLENLPNKFTRAIFTFVDGAKLFFNDMRKFGWLKIADKAGTAKITAEYGVEPLGPEFTLKKFKEILAKYPKRKIKQILMDQSLIAGIGNIYNDESCFMAGILPMRLASSLSELEIKRLFIAIPKILKLSIEKGGTSADTYIRLDGSRGSFVPHLKVYGRKGEKCRRGKCRGMIKRIKLNGRGTHFCDACQK